jgi:uncharacterized protein (TIGR02145 family)
MLSIPLAMKRILWITCGLPLAIMALLTGLSGHLSAQNTLGGSAGDPSAVLDLQSNSQGVLLPRMTTAERSAIANPAAGLMVYNTSLGCVEMNAGSSSSPNWLCMVKTAGKITGLDCQSVTVSGDIYEGVATDGLRFSIPYTGGNGGWYYGQQLMSTGITGITASVSAGLALEGGGNLNGSIRGTPSGVGMASFALSIGGESCTLDLSVVVPVGVIGMLDCAGATNTGTLTTGVAASGVSSSIPYSGGNGFSHDGETVLSTGVTGLTATLAAASFASGSGSLSYVITGTPSAAGTASFALNIGGQNCTLDWTVNLPVGSIGALNCAGATSSGALQKNQAASNVSGSIPYTGGNGGTYGGQTVSSTGITGLTATLAAGILASGAGNLALTISGTPTAEGIASFALSIGGQSCTFNIPVGCGAYVASGQWKQLMCHNLGANTSVDPLTPSWELNGNYYQWGRKPTCFGRDGVDGTNTCSSPVYGASGPWGNTTSNDNAGSITGWSSTAASTGSWADASKTTNDPCPTGFRVPTKTQWEGVINSSLNTYTLVGTWSSSARYASGVRFGSTLFLPASGNREQVAGSQSNAGVAGLYWTSTQNSTSNSWYTLVGNNSITMLQNSKNIGMSVRCIAE